MLKNLIQGPVKNNCSGSFVLPGVENLGQESPFVRRYPDDVFG